MNVNRVIKRIVLFYLLIPAIILGILYPLLPYFLNYPPNSINSNLQKEIDSLTYSQQYILLVFAGLLISLIILFVSLYKIRNNIKKINEKNISKKDFEQHINSVIRLCINTPLILYLSEIIVPLIILPFALLSIGANQVVVIKISITIILSLTLASVLCYTFTQKEFKIILTYLHDSFPEYLSNIKDIKINKLYKKLNSFSSTFLLEILPLFVFCMVFLSLRMYTFNSNLVSNIYNESYSSALHSAFDNKVFNDANDIISNFDKIKLIDSSHTKFILKDENSYYTSDNSNLSTFFKKYTLQLSEQNDNRTYDYFCLDNSGTVIPININGQKYFVGVEYNTGSIHFLFVLLLIFVILLIIICLILIYISSSISKNLNIISSGLHKISIGKYESKQLPVTSVDEIGCLVSEFNDIQNLNQKQISQIKSNQDMLMEQERLASLGQLIGGISHNLKTPIMSISGAAEGLTDLINEYDASIGDPEVTSEDNHAIANDMRDWIEKIHSYTAYMSDIITAVKGQAVTLSESEQDTFTVDELVKRVNILMKHELQDAHVQLDVNLNNLNKIELHGNVNSLVQVVNNLITNSIQSYRGEAGKSIDLTANKENNNLFIHIKDTGCGIPQDVKNKLFKEMITTKGKNGTGLGMFMSYSTIKGKFNGDMTFISEENKGTEFIITLPID